MKVFVLYNVLCDYTCGCIIVAAESEAEAWKIINARNEDLYADTEEGLKLEEVTEGYYNAVWGGG